MRFSLSKRAVMVAVLAMLCSLQGRAASQWAPPSPASASSIPQSQLIQPEELNRLLHTRGAEKPLILQVGSHVLFAQAHIPGSEYAGSRFAGCGLAAVARPRRALAAQDLHRDLLRLLPVEPLPELGACVQGAHRYGIHSRESALSGR